MTNTRPAMTDLKFAKTLLWVNGCVPLALIAWDAGRHNLGADPLDHVLHSTGLIAIIFLTLSLAVTPVKKLSGWNDIIVFRRVLGLFAFYYAVIHVVCFAGVYGGWKWKSIYDQIHNATYMQLGLVSVLAMLPLALTSNNFSVRKFGPVKWQALHRLAYVAVIAGAIHYMLQGKFTTELSKYFAGTAAALLLFRYGGMFFAKKGPRTVVPTRGGPVVGTKPPGAKSVATKTAGIKPRFWKGRLKIARVFDETPDVRTFRLVNPDGGPIPFDYLPGQYMNLTLLVDGKKVNRSYTIASTPSRNGNVELTVKREAMGVSSRHLHDTVREGDLLDVSAPAGQFVFDGTLAGMPADSIVLLAGGVGITPVMSVARYLTDLAWPGDIYFIYSARTQADIIFKDELAHLAKRFPNFHLTITLTRDDNPDWKGKRGRIDERLLRQAVPDPARRLYHLCGPDPMMDPVREMLRELGVPEEKIRSEKFESPRPTPEPAAGSEPKKPSTPHEPGDPSPDLGENVIADTGANVTLANVTLPNVTFAATGLTVPADHKFVLELAEDAGIEIPFNCRAGICGTCKIKLLTGRVDMETRDALSAVDEKSGLILACQARPVGDISVLA